MSPQGWQDDQDGEGFALFDVGTAKINNLISGGVVRAQAATGLLQIGLVTYADIQTVGASRLLGNPTGSPATVSEIPINAPLFFSGGNLILNYDGTSLALSGGTTLIRAALSGDVAAPAGSNTTTIQPHVVSYAKMQQASAHVLIGNPTAATADLQEITLGTNLSFAGNVLNATGGGSGITQLTGDVIAGPGSGSQVATVVNLPNDVTMAGDLLTTQSAAPATPAASHGRIWFDSTSKNYLGINEFGNTGAMVHARSAFPSQFVTGLGLSGTLTAAQPTFTDISGQATLAQLPSIGANTLLGNPTGSTATPAAISLGTTSGVLQYLNGSPDTLPVFAVGAARIPFGSGSNGQLTDSASLSWNNSTGELFIVPGSATNGIDVTGASSGVVGFHVKNTTNGVTAQVQTVVENSAGSLGYYGISSPSYAGFAPLTGGQAFFGGSSTPVSVFTQSAQPIIFYANAVEVGRWLSGGGLKVGSLTTAMTKAVAGVLTDAAAGTDYQAPVVWPAASQVIVSAGVAVDPLGDSTFTFDRVAHVMAAGNCVAINGASIPTNVSLILSPNNNANRDRVQFFVGGGGLPATGTTGDSTLFDLFPNSTTILPGVTSGTYATERIRSLTYTSAAATSVSLLASLYIDDAPAIGSIGHPSSGNGRWALWVNAGGINADVIWSRGSMQCVTFSGGKIFTDSTSLGFFGAASVAQQTGGAATAGATYTATEQAMINRMYAALRNYGLLS